MALLKKEEIKGLKYIRAIVKTPDGLIIKAIKKVVCLDPDTFQLKWEIPYPNEIILSYKLISYYNGKIYHVYTDEEKSNSELHVLDGKSGDLVWKSPLNWRVYQNNGGFFLFEESICFHDFLNEKTHFIKLNASNGDKVGEWESPRLVISGRVQGEKPTLLRIEKELVFCSLDKGLYRTDLNDPNKVEKLAEGYPICIKAIGDHFVCVWESDPFQVSVSDFKGEEISRFSLGSDNNIIGIWINEDDTEHILLQYEDSGLGLLNIKSGKLVWRKGKDEDWGVLHVSIRENTIYLVGFEVSDTQFLILDWETGKLKSNPLEQDGAYADSTLFIIDDLLLIDGWNGLLVYEFG